MSGARRGRPPIGPLVKVHLPMEYLTALTRLRGDRYTQPEMLRQLIEEALIRRGEIESR